MIFNEYPYINVNDLNLDYILKQIKVMMNEVTNFVSINAIKYADPIQWDITRQYEKNTVVIDPVTGTAYISVAPVPEGVALTRPEYWTVVFDLGSFVTRAAQNFTSHYEESTTLTATFPTSTGGWLVWGDVLYKALTNITAGDTYVVDGNIEHFTIEDLYNAYLNTIASILAMVGDLADLTTSDTSSIVNAINSVVSDYTAADVAINNKIGDLDNLTTTDKTSVVNAIDEIDSDLAQEVIDRGNADNTLQAAIDAIKLTNIPVNILDCGITGDGSDESTALQAVLNGTYGRYVVIPAGVSIHVFTTIHMTVPILLEGVSNLSSKIIGHGNIDVLQIDNITANSSIIKNIGFDYYGGWDAVTAGVQLKIEASECHVDNCAFYHFVKAITINNAIDCKITNCYMTEGNSVQSNIYGVGIEIGNTAYVTGVKIDGLTILSDNAKTLYNGIRLKYADGVYFSNMLINRPNICVNFVPDNKIVHSVTFESCILDQAQQISIDMLPQNGGRLQNIRFHNCWITTNSYTSNTAVALRGAAGTTTQFIEFIECCMQSAALAFMVDGTNISDVVLIGNTFTEISGNVLLVNNGSKLVFIGNVISINVESANSYTNGFNIQGGSDIILAHNISTQATTYDCIIGTPANLKYWQNIFTNSNLYDNEHCAGTTAERPVVKYVGMPYYDSTLAKPIWWNGADWIDAAGNVQT